MKKYFIAYLIAAGFATGIVAASSEASAANFYWCASKGGVTVSFSTGIYDDPSNPPRFGGGWTHVGSVSADNQTQADKKCQAYASSLVHAGGGQSVNGSLRTLSTK